MDVKEVQFKAEYTPKQPLRLYPGSIYFSAPTGTNIYDLHDMVADAMAAKGINPLRYEIKSIEIATQGASDNKVKSKEA